MTFMSTILPQPPSTLPSFFCVTPFGRVLEVVGFFFYLFTSKPVTSTEVGGWMIRCMDMNWSTSVKRGLARYIRKQNARKLSNINSKHLQFKINTSQLAWDLRLKGSKVSFKAPKNFPMLRHQKKLEPNWASVWRALLLFSFSLSGFYECNLLCIVISTEHVTGMDY